MEVVLSFSAALKIRMILSGIGRFFDLSNTLQIPDGT
jgi:hypothetical protein